MKSPKPKKQRKSKALAALDPRDALEPRQRAFVDAYLSNGFNGSRAALSAGYSKSSCRVAACRLLTNNNIRAIIDQETESANIGAKQVIARLAEIATLNVADFVNDDGTLKPGSIKKMGHLIRGIDPANGTRGIKVELHNSLDALKELAKIHKLYDASVTVNNLIPVNFIFDLKPEDIPL